MGDVSLSVLVGRAPVTNLTVFLGLINNQVQELIVFQDG